MAWVAITIRIRCGRANRGGHGVDGDLDNTIGRNASVTGLRTCWLGFIRNTVMRNVNFSNNVTFDPDGNEVVTNSIRWNLNCHDNSPAPQLGDSGGALNTVGRKATGQCKALT